MPGYVDAHVHFWDRTNLHYPWLDDPTPFGDRYVLDDYRAATADDPPDQFVVVEADVYHRDTAAEARWVEGMCAAEPDYGGMVVWAPMDLGGTAVRRHLDDLGVERVRGARRIVQWDPPGLAAKPGFVEAAAALGARDLTFDLCLLPRHLDDAAVLARGAPDTRIVLDHLGKPDIAGGGYDEWLDGFARLGGLGNVWCKLSGLVTEADVGGWTVDDLRPYLHIALEAFGVDRILWGSDWPVLTAAATHRRWREASGELLAPLSDDEKAMVGSRNAVDAYNLPPPGS